MKGKEFRKNWMTWKHARWCSESRGEVNAASGSYIKASRKRARAGKSDEVKLTIG